MARRGSRFIRGPRRATDWGASSVQSSKVNIAAASAVLDEVFVPIVGGETLIRTRGALAYSSDQAIATETQVGAFGICVVTAQAVSVGITAIPHPATDAAWGGWLYHQFLQRVFRFGTAVGMEPDFMHQIEVDSKAMRKVDEDERLITVWENTSSTHGIDTLSSFRFLSKVH